MDEPQLLTALRSIVREETGQFATKTDLEGFATKADLEGFATKADLLGLATQENVDENDRQLRALIGTLATQESMDANDRQLRMLIENSMSRIEKLLREDYGRIAGAAAQVADYDQVKSTVAQHQAALENHNQRLTELEQKVI